MLTVFVVSGSSGATGERVARAALAQFENAPTTLVRRGSIRTPEQLCAVVQEARNHESVILHTLVDDELRRLMLTESRSNGVDVMDLLGPVLDRLAVHLKLEPLGKPGLFSQLMEAKSRGIEAVDFAFRHDDGQNTKDLDRAEIVLVGASRTMKTPTMLYLAYQGWFAANVPLVHELFLPEGLRCVPSERVFCLMMASGRLQELRRARANNSGIPLEPYASAEQIRKELRYAEQVCLAHGWRSIDVSAKSVEEVGREITTLLKGVSPVRKPTE